MGYKSKYHKILGRFCWIFKEILLDFWEFCWIFWEFYWIFREFCYIFLLPQFFVFSSCDQESEQTVRKTHFKNHKVILVRKTHFQNQKPISKLSRSPKPIFKIKNRHWKISQNWWVMVKTHLRWSRTRMWFKLWWRRYWMKTMDVRWMKTICCD